MKRVILGAASLLVLASCGGDNDKPSASPPPPPVSQTPTPSPAPAPSPTPAPAPAPTVALFEGFDAAALDRDLWNVVGPELWVNNEQQVYLDSPDTIVIRQGVDGAEGGVLELRPVYRTGQDTNADRNADFISGRINSRGRYDFTHGRAEARIRMPDGQGLWPAFWLLGNGDWPATGEIDIMEYVGENEWTSSALHGPGYSGDTPLAKRYTFPAGTDVTDWHVYSVDWTADSIAFAVDGNVFYTVSKADVEAYGAWAFDNPKYLILNFAVGGGYPAGVNGVSAPYYGLPQATVGQIKAGGVAMQVDWVRVTPEE